MEPELRKVRLADKTGGLVWTRANMREQSEYCDVALISQEGQKFPAHRLILGVTSSYLRAKMQRNSGPEIEMKTVKTELLSSLLSFIYEGETVIKEADTALFIETAQKWRIRQFLRVKKKKKVQGKITKSENNPDNAGGDGGVGGGGPTTEGPQKRTYTCKYCPTTFPTKKRQLKHLWRKTFELSEINGDVKNLTEKGDDGWSCFCGFRNKLHCRVLAHAQRHVSDIQFKCEVCQYSTKTKAALYKHKLRKHGRA